MLVSHQRGPPIFPCPLLMQCNTKQWLSHFTCILFLTSELIPSTNGSWKSWQSWGSPERWWGRGVSPDSTVPAPCSSHCPPPPPPTPPPFHPPYPHNAPSSSPPFLPALEQAPFPQSLRLHNVIVLNESTCLVLYWSWLVFVVVLFHFQWFCGNKVQLSVGLLLVHVDFTVHVSSQIGRLRRL